MKLWNKFLIVNIVLFLTTENLYSQCSVRAAFGQYSLPLTEVVVYVYGADTGKVVYATITDSSGMFVIPKEICDSHDSLFIVFNTMRYRHKKVKFQCCQDEINVDPSIVGFAMIDPPVQIVLPTDPYIEEFRSQAMRTGYPSALEVPMRIQSFDPLALLSRKSGWDVNITLEGMQSKQLRAKLEGSSLYSLCPMEMGGCLAGLQSFLTENLTIDYSTTSSGSALLNFNLTSVEFERFPYFSAEAFGQASTLGSGVEGGVKALFSSPSWFVYSGVVHSRANSYYAGNKILVENSDFNNLGASFKLSRRLGRMAPELTYFMSRTVDAGYPTLKDIRIKKEERHVVSLIDNFSIGRIKLQYSFAYQSGTHIMQMTSIAGEKVNSGANSKIYDASISMKRIFNVGFKNIFTQFSSQLTIWDMDAFLQKQSLPNQTSPQVEKARVLEWGNYLHFTIRKRINNALGITAGLANLSWRAKNRDLHRFVVPSLIVEYDHFNAFKKLTVKFTGEHSYRTPTPVELYREHVILPSGRYLLSLADSLLPEKYFTVRAIINKGLDFYDNGYVTISFQGFSRLVKNYIFLKEYPNVPSPLPSIAPTVVAYQNIDDLLLAGVGMKLKYENNKFTANFLLGYTWGEFLTDHSPAPYIATLFGRCSIGYMLTKWLIARMSFEGMPSQTRINHDFGQIPSPAYIKIDFSLNGKINNWLEFTAYVNNILDQYYFLPTSYSAVPEPGRFAGVSVKVNFDKFFIPDDEIVIAEFKVPMQCPKCVKAVKRILKDHIGVVKVETDYETDIVKVWFNYAMTNEIRILHALMSEYHKSSRLVNVYLPSGAK